MFSISRLQTLMKPLPLGVFDRAVEAAQADKHRKGFSCWSQLVALVYAQLSGASSLRSLTQGFNAHSSHHYHLGVGALSRSTLSDANAATDPAVFAAVAQALMAQAHRGLRQEGVALLQLLDSTSITLKGRGFDAWTFESRTRNTQGIKLHVLYDAQTQAPCCTAFSDANVNDIALGRQLTLHKGVRYVFDKGYCDYAWWQRIDDEGAHFVTRFKSNARLTRVQALPLPADKHQSLIADEVVCFTHRSNRGQHRNPCQQTLRRITIARPDQRPLVLATNDLHSPASGIARNYQDRWGIELFFKWIKQHLQLGRFLGRSQNAVKIQILCALIAYLLVVLYRQTHAVTQTLWECLALLRASLFQRPDSESYRRQRREHRAAAHASQINLFV